VEECCFPRSGSQAGLLVWADSSAPLGILNLSVLVDLEPFVRPDLYLEAIRQAVSRVPYCRIRLHDMPDGTTEQYISENAIEGFGEVEDFSQMSERRMKKSLKKEAVRPFPNRLRDCQLYRGKLIRGEKGEHRFFFTVHHSIMDLYAVMFFLNYIDKVYCALEQGGELPAPCVSPEKLVRKSLEFEQTEKYRSLVRWWEEQFTPEPRFTSLNGAGSGEFIKGKQYGKNRNRFQMRVKKIVHTIPKELVEQVNAAATTQRVSPQSFYMLALREYLGRVSNTEDVTIYTNASRRATLEQKSTGLTRAVGLLVRTVFGEDVPFREGVEKVDIASKNCYRHTEVANIDDGILQPLYNHPIGTKYYSVMFTFTPFINYDEIHTFKRAESFDSGIALAPVYMLIMPTDQSGSLTAVYNCASWYMKTQSVHRFHAFMLKFLEMGIANPEMSIKELADACM